VRKENTSETEHRFEYHRTFGVTECV